MNKEQAKAWLPLIQAVAEGKKLQVVKMTQGSHEPVWCDIEFNDLSYFNLGEYARLRIKPEPKKQSYRVALMKAYDETYWTKTSGNKSSEILLEADEYFISWLTDRIEYELPEVQA